MIELYQGDCLEVMKGMEENSVSAIVTDPPYGLSFMGKKWDYEVPSVEIWEEALRVLKPGGTALIFAGSRTQHRMAVNIEDAGFILKDCIMWIYGSGFPKSTDISKQIDKKAGTYVKGEILPSSRTSNESQTGIATTFREKTAANPQCEAAQLWNGYGTALKPAYEPIIVAMKPNDGTYANNALKHGVAGINIDGCRVAAPENDPNSRPNISKNTKESAAFGGGAHDGYDFKKGRFPANIIHDGSEEVLRLFPETKSGKDKNPAKNSNSGFTGNGIRTEDVNYGDSGSASRFFYCAKASKSERGEGNNHPTVKPLALCRYLIRLVKMPGKTIALDNFMGSGTIGKASKLEGVSFIGIEKEIPSFKIAQNRINNAV